MYYRESVQSNSLIKYMVMVIGAVAVILLNLIVAITATSSASLSPEVWSPRSFTMDELMLFGRRLSIRQELMSTGVILVDLRSSERAVSDDIHLFMESIVDVLTNSVVKNIVVASNTNTDRNGRNNYPILQGINTKLDSSKDDHDNGIASFISNNGVLSALLPNTKDGKAIVDVEFTSGDVGQIHVASNEVLFFAGTQWSHTFENSKTMHLRSISYHVVSYTGFTERIYYDQAGYDYTIQRIALTHLDHDQSRIHNDKDSAKNFLGMDMDDDMGDDDSFCSGGGMIMNMDGMGISFSNSNRSCLNYYFERWTLDTNGKFLCAMFGTIGLGMLAEYLPLFKRKTYSKIKDNRRKRIIMTGLHVLQLAIGYACMLAAMTYSFEIFSCLLLGFGIGFSLFTNHDEIPMMRVDPCCVDANILPERTPLLSTDQGQIEDASVHHVD